MIGIGRAIAPFCQGTGRPRCASHHSEGTEVRRQSPAHEEEPWDRSHRLTRRITTFALGVGAGVAAYAAVSSGVLGTATTVRPPAAAAAELPAFDDCEQLRQWYVDQALRKVGPWGLSGPPVMYAMEKGAANRTFGEASPAQPKDAVGSSGTGTNVQEADVDESDVAKTDGRLVVQVRGNRLVVTDVSGAAPRQLSDTRLPGTSLVQPELLLRGDHVVVVGEEAGRRYGGPIFWGRTDSPDTSDSGPDTGPGAGRGFLPGPPQDPRTRVIGVDIADPASPAITDDRSIDGGSVSARQYPDGTVRVVVTTGYPPLDFVQPNRDRSEAEATRLNRRIVEQAPIDAWLPGVRDDGGDEHPLLDCSDVRHPVKRSGGGTISVLTFPADDPGDSTATGVTASGDLVYSSARRLYVATTADRSTSVHAFALDGDRTTYVASGLGRRHRQGPLVLQRARRTPARRRRDRRLVASGRERRRRARRGGRTAGARRPSRRPGADRADPLGPVVR